MPRRNHRASFEPLDLTPPGESRGRIPGPVLNGREHRERLWRLSAERAERERLARIAGGIDWSVCLVPGCGRDPDSLSRNSAREHTVELPMCTEHVLVAHRQAVRFKDSDEIRDRAAAQVAAELERQRTAEEERRAAYLARTDGDIYFVRLNGLVKVGWSRSLHRRLRAYGPDVEVLCHYPATRDDETNLHRQLTPARAKGREWYEDGAIVQDFIAKALAQYGPPTAEAWWSTPKAPTPRLKRAGRQ